MAPSALSSLSASDRFRTLFRVAATALGLFTLLRVALLLRSWGEMAHPVRDALSLFATGLLYDAAFLFYFCAPLALFLLFVPERAYRSRWMGWISRGAFFAYLFGLYFAAVAEWIFWDEFFARFNFIAVDYLIYRREVTENISQSYPLPLILGAIGTAALLHLFLAKRLRRSPSGTAEPFRARLAWALPLLFLASVGLFLGQRPREGFANNFEREVASNGPYQFFAAFRNNVLDYRAFYAVGDDATLSRVAKQEVGKDPELGGLYDIERPVSELPATPRWNVILVSVESLSADFMARFGNTKGITPFLDGLEKESLFFTDLYATGTRTDRGLEAITLSVPPTPGRSLVKRPDNAGLYSLGEVFADHGYDVAFLYGGRGQFDNMNAFFSGNGYRVVDQGQFTSEEVTFSNAWGVADEDLFRRVIREADAEAAEGKPFFFHAMTTSNHRPYTYPSGRIDIPSGTGRDGAVKYTDYALGRLIAESKGHPWFERTIFVVVADHCSSSAGRVGLPVEKYHIPLFIYAPGLVAPREVETLSSQVDVAPTLLALLKLGYDDHFWGRDILAPDFRPRALLGNYQKLGLFEDGRLVILSPRRRIEIMDDPEKSDAIRSLPSGDPFAEEAMAYYQGADFIQRNHLDRVAPKG